MSRHLKFVYSILLSLCANIDVGHTATIYSQVGPSAPIGAYSSNDTPTGQKIADNFLVNTPGAATIRSIRFIGGYGNRTPPPQTPPLNALPPDDFRVVFFADSEGIPGSPLGGGDVHVGAPVQRTATGGPLLNGIYIPIEYVVNLGIGIAVNPATPYWMSVVNNAGSNYGWVWARTAGIFDQQVTGTEGNVTSGPWEVSSDGGMFFELSDNNVPEPASLGILLTTGLGLWWFRIRRVRKRGRDSFLTEWLDGLYFAAMPRSARYAPQGLI